MEKRLQRGADWWWRALPSGGHDVMWVMREAGSLLTEGAGCILVVGQKGERTKEDRKQLLAPYVWKAARDV